MDKLYKHFEEIFEKHHGLDDKSIPKEDKLDKFIKKKISIMDKSLYTEYELQQLREYGYVKYPVKKKKK